MEHTPANFIRWLFDPKIGPRGRLAPRWIFLRALAAIYFSAFFSLLFQVKGLIGPDGILPAQEYLTAVSRSFGVTRYWYAPSLFWISSSSNMVMAVAWIGLVASVIAFLNLWPRLSLLICFVCFLSFVSAAGEFSSYQSDGMLLEAGFLALFFAPTGVHPGWGASYPGSRAGLFLLQWEWFRIYFESGMVKLVSGDPQWRHLTAMDEYYQNGPLPTWIGWYVEHLPNWFHEMTAACTLAMELVLVLMLFFPRRVRLICFLIVTPWEVAVILTANYTFLNYLVLSLGFLLLDDKTLLRFVPGRFRPPAPVIVANTEPREEVSLSILAVNEAALSNSHCARSYRAPISAHQARRSSPCSRRGFGRGDAFMDRLRHNRGNDWDSFAQRAAAHRPHRGSRTFSHRQSVRPVRCDDARTVRN